MANGYDQLRLELVALMRHAQTAAHAQPGPIVTVEIDTETYKARAHPIQGAERDRLYAQHATVHASFNEYVTKTSRVIPLVGR